MKGGIGCAEHCGVSICGDFQNNLTENNPEKPSCAGKFGLNDLQGSLITSAILFVSVILHAMQDVKIFSYCSAEFETETRPQKTESLSNLLRPKLKFCKYGIIFYKTREF